MVLKNDWIINSEQGAKCGKFCVSGVAYPFGVSLLQTLPPTHACQKECWVYVVQVPKLQRDRRGEHKYRVSKSNGALLQVPSFANRSLQWQRVRWSEVECAEVVCAIARPQSVVQFFRICCPPRIIISRLNFLMLCKNATS